MAPAIARIEPLTTARALRGPFDYRLPDAMGGEVGVGSLLLVPFGRRELPGVVVGLAERSAVPSERLLAPRRALAVDVPPELVELAGWIAREYCSTPARALALMLPAGATRGVGPRMRVMASLTRAGRELVQRGRGQGVSQVAPERAGHTGDRGLAQGPGDDSPAEGPGVRSAADELGARSAGDHAGGHGPAANRGDPAVGRGEDARRDGIALGGRRGARPLTARQWAIVRALANGPAPASGVEGGLGGLRRLEARGLVALEMAELGRRPRHVSVGARRQRPPELSEHQRHALAQIEEALAQRRGGCVLLHGVTGSGKTEVYLRAAARALEQGRGAIVLVPEIGLTPQMVGRFRARFGDTVAVLHSRLSMGERFDEWRRLRAGGARVCVGPRSAVFAPVGSLGLLVVDEEHDSSYKHEGDPRYDARTVAAERARAAGALLLLGSATPRAESWARSARLRMPARVDGGRLPAVQVLDMRGQAGALHPLTVQALADVRHTGGKAIVLLNRRGWSAFVRCGECGVSWGCPACDVTLVLHRGEGSLRCHHCGHCEGIPQQCACGSRSLARHGMGTEHLERRLETMLGDESFPVFRLDADVTSAGAPGEHGRSDVGALLRRFEDARAGVLLGTQMVAKGHDFPGVALGVVLDADAALSFPDFRAEERAFALVTQLAGRVGRGGDGRVLVQARAARARALRFAAAHDSEGFLAGELERRRALAYPPFAELVRVVCAAPEARAALAAAEAMRGRIEQALAGAPRVRDATTMLGPAILFRLRGAERGALLLKTRERAGAVAAVGEAVGMTASERRYADVSFSVDVDPH